MRLVRAGVAVAVLPLLSGCGYVHFGRLPRTNPGGDAALAEAYTNLALEHKILKQELALTRKEGETLRVALERAAGDNQGASDALARLEEATRELAALRASHARLEAERAAGPRAASAEKLAASSRARAQLEEENTRLKAELDRARADNVALETSLRTATAQTEQAQAALAQLKAELLAQKEARADATMATAGDLRSALARAAVGTAPAATMAHTESAATVASLQAARLPRAEALPSVRSQPRDELAPPAGRTAQEPSPAAKRRTHIVRSGDTLEQIARQYYGASDRWPAIYAANADTLATGQPLRAGMELHIPEQ